MKQEGVHLPAKFFQRIDWHESLESVKLAATQKLIVTSFMEGIDAMKTAEDKITEELVKIEDKRCSLLESIPAIGKITSRVIVSALDNAERFDDKKSVANYCALTPTIYQSGDTKSMGRINRDGRQEVRKVLLQCAHTLVRTKNHPAAPLREFFERVEKRRGKKRAVVATARKLLTVAYGVLKSNTAYDPKKLYAYTS